MVWCSLTCPTQCFLGSMGRNCTRLPVCLCPHATHLWNQLSRILEHLLGTHKISDTTVIYGYKRSDSTAHQLANFLLTLAKSTIFKTYMAAVGTDGQPPSYYYRLLLLHLRYRLFLEMHKSVTNNDMDGFRNYCLKTQALGKL
jgi:hypothetical protein